MSIFRDRFALFYPMRILGSYFLVLLIILHTWQFESFGVYELGLIGFLLLHPHLFYLLERMHAHNRAKIEHRAFLIDAFVLGVTVHLNAFSFLPSLLLITVGLVNALAVEGPRQMAKSLVVLLVGVLAPMPFFGVNFFPRNALGVDIACSGFLFVYFTLFAYSSYNRSRLLTESQEELQEQKATLEIEKMRSDRLLLNMVPAQIVEDLEKKGRTEPAVYDPLTVVAISFRDFSTAVENWDPEELLEVVTHCFRGIDAIVERYGLEKVKIMGDLYLAVAGLPVPQEKDVVSAIDAAHEIHDFLSDVNLRREAQGLRSLQPRIGVHSGRGVGALVVSARLSYEIWGRVVPEVIRLHREALPGQVLLSPATRRLAGVLEPPIESPKASARVGGEEEVRGNSIQGLA